MAESASDEEIVAQETEDQEENNAVTRNQFNLDEYAADVEDIDLTFTRTDAVPDLTRFSSTLQNLTFRSNLITSINENLRPLTSLVELDLYENQICAIEGLESLVNLKHLDLSFNRYIFIGDQDREIREIVNLDKLVNLTALYLVHNKISVIQGLDQLVNLEIIELGSNKIKQIENLGHLKKLKELYLGKNKIRQIQGLDTLTNLRLLSLPANRLVKIENLDALVDLEELYISEQGISELSGLETNTKLTVLDVAKNEINKLTGVEKLKELTDLWANDCHVSDWKEVDKLKDLPNLDTVYLERNPIYAQDPNSYRRKDSPEVVKRILGIFQLMLAAPQVKQIDATMCR